MTLLNNTLPEKRRGKLKALLEKCQIVRALEAHNGLSGIIANNTQVQGEYEGKPLIREFDAIWESSLTDSASKGHPDIEVVTFDSRLQTINEILAVTNKPMIVDGDTGGDVNAFEYTVSKLERVGVSAIIIEDKIFPKRNSLEAGVQQNLEDPEIFAQKIRRGKQIQTTNEFMIIARLESLIAGKPMKDALHRAKIYLQAGVDGIMIHSKSKSSDEILQFAQHYKKISAQLNLNKPLVCVPTTYNQTTEKELASAERRNEKANVKGATARKTSHEAYVRNLQKYLKDGDYVDTFYGEHQEKRIGNRCLAQAYYWEGPKKGEPKFDVGTYYPLLGTVYSQEMYNADNGVENADVQNPKKRRKYTKRSVEGKTKKRGKAS